MPSEISQSIKLASIMESWKHLHKLDDAVVKNVASQLRLLESCNKEAWGRVSNLEKENKILRDTLNRIVDITDTVFGDGK